MPYRPAQFAARGFCLPFCGGFVCMPRATRYHGHYNLPQRLPLPPCRRCPPGKLLCYYAPLARPARLRHSRSFFKSCRVWVQGHPFGAGALPRALPTPCLCAAARRGQPFCAGRRHKTPRLHKSFRFSLEISPFPARYKGRNTKGTPPL